MPTGSRDSSFLTKYLLQIVADGAKVPSVIQVLSFFYIIIETVADLYVKFYNNVIIILFLTKFSFFIDLKNKIYYHKIKTDQN